MTIEDRKTLARILEEQLKSGAPEVELVLWLLNQLAGDKGYEIVIRRKARLVA